MVTLVYWRKCLNEKCSSRNVSEFHQLVNAACYFESELKKKGYKGSFKGNTLYTNILYEFEYDIYAYV